MGFRTVIIRNRAKLEYRLNSLIVRSDRERKIFIDEINTLIIQSTAVSLTAALLSELVKSNIKVIFCDEKCNPCAELLPYYGAHNTVKKYREQFLWGDIIKAKIWRAIIKQKIYGQAKLLYECGYLSQAGMLNEYADNVESGDITNREGHAAKVYFNAILGQNGSRRDDNFINAALNYGYAVILSAFNREIVASGYLTQIGIWHCNEYNSFNLSCDLMEPFRVIVDRTVIKLSSNDKDFKRKLVDILNYKTQIDGQTTTLDLAIRKYVKSVFNALSSGDVQSVIFYDKVEMPDEL